MLAIATAEVWRIERDARSQLHGEGDAQIRSFINARELLRHGLSLRSSEAIESIIDSFSYIVVDALNEMKKKPSQSADTRSLELPARPADRRDREIGYSISYPAVR